MKTMAISFFKAHALEAVDRVSTQKEHILITNRGKPVAEVIPYQGKKGASIPGRLASALVREGDIVSPLGSEMWEAGS